MRRQWVGLGVGLIGVAIVVGGDARASTLHGWAYALPLVGVAGLVAATLLERRARPRIDVSQSLAFQCTISAVLFSAVAIWQGDAAPPATAAFWAAVAWLVVLSTFGGYGLYWLALRRGGLVSVNALIYLTAPTTFVWALVMFGQPIATSTFVGLGICLVAVLLARDAPTRQLRRTA